MKTLDKKLIDKKFKTDDFLVEHPEISDISSSPVNAHSIAKMMDIKKVKTERGKREKTLFLSIGLCLSLLLILGAFEWKNYTDESMVDMATSNASLDEVIEIPPTEQPPPPPPKIDLPQIVEVADEIVVEQEIEINLDVSITEDTRIQEVIVSMPQEEQQEEADEIFTIVEQQPQPVGGMAAFYKYVGENLKYPSTASRMNIEGRVFVQFVVEKDGLLTDIQVVKGIGAGCDEEAVRVISNAPKWEPGKQRGRPVRVRMILPIVFKLVV